MKRFALLLSLLVATTALAASDAIYLPNIPGNATGTSSGGSNGLDVAVIAGGGTKLEDAAHASGDQGVFTLCVRNDAGTALAADGDYIPCTTDSSGAIWTRANEVATAADAGALPALTKVVSGYDGANVQVMKTDATGSLQVDVESSELPTGAATAANQGTAIGHLSVIELNSQQLDVTLSTRASEVTLDALNNKVTNDYGLASAAVRTASQVGNASGAADFNAGNASAQTLRVVVASDQAVIPVSDNGGSLTVDGTVAATQSGTWTNRISDGTDVVDVTAAGEMEVSLTTALPAGTNNIGDVDVLSQPARSHATDSTRVGDGTDLVDVTAAGELEVSLTTALPAGTNNIGDVDVLSQPARSHTTDSIRIGDGTDLIEVSGAGAISVDLVSNDGVRISGTGGGTIGTSAILGNDAMNVALTTTEGTGIGDATTPLVVDSGGTEATDSTAASATGAAESESAPADAVGFLLSADGANTDSIRWRIGGTASATAGHELEPGRDSGYIPAGVNLSIFAVSGTQTYQLTWVRR
jgi:hypothetical protein